MKNFNSKLLIFNGNYYIVTVYQGTDAPTPLLHRFIQTGTTVIFFHFNIALSVRRIEIEVDASHSFF